MQGSVQWLLDMVPVIAFSDVLVAINTKNQGGNMISLQKEEAENRPERMVRSLVPR